MADHKSYVLTACLFGFHSCSRSISTGPANPPKRVVQRHTERRDPIYGVPFGTRCEGHGGGSTSLKALGPASRRGLGFKTGHQMDAYTPYLNRIHRSIVYVQRGYNERAPRMILCLDPDTVERRPRKFPNRLVAFGGNLGEGKSGIWGKACEENHSSFKQVNRSKT